MKQTTIRIHRNHLNVTDNNRPTNGIYPQLHYYHPHLPIFAKHDCRTKNVIIYYTPDLLSSEERRQYHKRYVQMRRK